MTKSTMLCTILAAGALMICAGTASAQGSDHKVVAQGVTASMPSGGSNAATPQSKALVGSWLETVTFSSGRPQLKSLVSFQGDGTAINSDQGSVTTDPSLVFSAGHGVWVWLEKRTFAYTLLELISDLSGNLVGYLKVRSVYTVSESGNEYTGTSHFTVLDTTGNTLDSGDVTNAGQRISVELP